MHGWVGVSPLGEYARPLQLLLSLTAVKPIARAYTRLPQWLPPVRDGRSFQACPCCRSAVGTLFSLQCMASYPCPVAGQLLACHNLVVASASILHSQKKRELDTGHCTLAAPAALWRAHEGTVGAPSVPLGTCRHWSF